MPTGRHSIGYFLVSVKRFREKCLLFSEFRHVNAEKRKAARLSQARLAELAGNARLRYWICFDLMNGDFSDDDLEAIEHPTKKLGGLDR